MVAKEAKKWSSNRYGSSTRFTSKFNGIWINTQNCVLCKVAELPYGIRGACIHTNMTPNQRRTNIEKAVAGELHFLLMSPEMIVGSSSFICGVSSGLLSRLPPIAFTCIDEAHCVSEWSHHFRPSYLRVCMVWVKVTAYEGQGRVF